MLLNDGLETIGKHCFFESGLEEVTIPGSVRSIEQEAFLDSHLKRVCFLGATEGTNTDVRLPAGRQLVIGEEAFARCGSLRQVIFDPGSAVTEIRCKAFHSSGIESFNAPPSLRKIGAVAFRECRALKIFEPNEDI